MTPPIVYMYSDGIGTRNSKKRIGKINTISAFKLNKINVIPITKIGNDKT